MPLINETIGARLKRTVSDFGSSLALVSAHQQAQLTYNELYDMVVQASQGLLSIGLQPGDRVGIWASNRYEWTVMQYATSLIGAILVNINPAYQLEELIYALQTTGVQVLLLDAELKGRSLIDLAAKAQKTVPHLRHLIVLGEDGDLQTDHTTDNGSFMSWETLMSNSRDYHERHYYYASQLRAIEEQLQPLDAINIQFTSGTTGKPKGATLSHCNIVNNALFVGARCGYDQHDRINVPVPLYHCFGQVMGNLAAMVHGAAVVYPDKIFNSQATLKAVEAFKCTSLYGVPTMFIKLLQCLKEHAPYDLCTLRTGIMAGSPCPPEVMKKVRNEMNMKDITICYGMTETSPVSFQTVREDSEEVRVSTVGRIHPHLEAKIVDPESGTILPEGGAGEICVRGYSVMTHGYWNEPHATQAAISEDGWMRTGDLGIFEGLHCRIVGRLKDCIIRGGENIFPQEIEDTLHRHVDIIDVQVFGVPDEIMGEEVCAWVRLTQEVEIEELKAFCKRHLSSFKVPRYWKVLDSEESFPLTVTGKPQKYVMRALAQAELGLE